MQNISEAPKVLDKLSVVVEVVEEVIGDGLVELGKDSLGDVVVTIVVGIVVDVFEVKAVVL